MHGARVYALTRAECSTQHLTMPAGLLGHAQYRGAVPAAHETQEQLYSFIQILSAVAATVTCVECCCAYKHGECW